MAARLTSTGVTFSDGTSLNSKYGIVPKDAVSIFYQSGAPTNWSKVTAHNDKTLRVVSGTGGGSGGGTAFTSVFPNSTIPISLSGSVTGGVGNRTLTAPQLPVHSHGNGGSIGLSFTNTGDVGSGPGWTRSFPGTGGMSGVTGGGSHNHPFSASASFSTSLDLRVRYIDVILCKFN
jgi:hypothetical protein